MPKGKIRSFLFHSKFVTRHRAGFRNAGRLIVGFGVLMFVAGFLWFLTAGLLWNAYGVMNAFIVACLGIPVVVLGFCLWRVGTMIPSRRRNRNQHEELREILSPGAVEADAHVARRRESLKAPHPHGR